MLAKLLVGEHVARANVNRVLGNLDGGMEGHRVGSNVGMRVGGIDGG